MKRKFSSYGPVSIHSHYYCPRKELVDRAYTQLIGENIEEGGHYYTVWAPRQAGKTWILQQVLHKIEADERFYIHKFNLQSYKDETDPLAVINHLMKRVGEKFGISFPELTTLADVNLLFTKKYLDKPVIFIMDEFDAFQENVIYTIVSIFRDMYVHRIDEQKSAFEKTYLLHGVALIGVRSVVGVENKSGSPFNVQRSIHVPNLTKAEVESMFRWYEKDSHQKVEQEVLDKLYYETKGQPGLVSWFGELLTEKYNDSPDKPIGVENWETAYLYGTQILPNNTVLNLISKARDPEYIDTVLEIFRTKRKISFSFDNEKLNYLYMNGVINYEIATNEKRTKETYVKFASPFIQKRLFNRFANDIFPHTGELYDPFDDLSDCISEEELNIKNILKRYQTYIDKNRDWLFKDAPVRSDNRIYEAVFHFNLYRYMFDFMQWRENASVYPEFPTGNGKLDLLIHYENKRYGIEVKSYVDIPVYKRSLKQAAEYGKQLGLKQINLAVFVDYINDENRKKLEVDYKDKDTGVLVIPSFLAMLK